MANDTRFAWQINRCLRRSCFAFVPSCDRYKDSLQNGQINAKAVSEIDTKIILTLSSDSKIYSQRYTSSFLNEALSYLHFMTGGCWREHAPVTHPCSPAHCTSTPALPLSFTCLCPAPGNHMLSVTVDYFVFPKIVHKWNHPVCILLSVWLC